MLGAAAKATARSQLAPEEHEGGAPLGKKKAGKRTVASGPLDEAHSELDEDYSDIFNDGGFFGGGGKAQHEQKEKKHKKSGMQVDDTPEWLVAAEAELHSTLGDFDDAADSMPVKPDNKERDYVEAHCIIPPESYEDCGFDKLHGVKLVQEFAEQYTQEAVGAVKPVSGLLLFGPSGTGKSASTMALAKKLGGCLYQITAGDLPNGPRGAKRIDALFDIADEGSKPAIIFIDEADTFLGATAAQRTGHFASRWNRFKEGLLVVGATNAPWKIAPRLLTGRFERKILLSNPNPRTRLTLMQAQLEAEDDEPHLDKSDWFEIVKATAGRSAVNLQRLVSTAAHRAHKGRLPIAIDDFMYATQTEPSDYDEVVVNENEKFARKFG